MRLGLFELLFRAPMDKGGNPLFASQADLAEAVMAVEGGGFDRPDKKASSVKAFINQVLKGKRPLSPNLQKCILHAVDERLSASAHRDEVGVQLEQAFCALKDPNNVELPLDDYEEFEVLKEQAERATTHFITTYRPAEQTRPNEAFSTRAEQLRESLAINLGIANTSRNGMRPHCRYIFNLPNESIARAFWTMLIKWLEVKSIQNPFELLEQIGRSPDPALQVYVQDPHLCVLPTVVYDPELDRRAGFVLFYHGTNRVSVARMSRDALSRWYETIYLPSTCEPEKFHRRRLLVTDCLEPQTYPGEGRHDDEAQ